MRGIIVTGALAAAAAAADLALFGRLRAVGEWWFALHSPSLQVAQPAIERHVWPFLWDPLIVTLLQQPLAAVLLGLAGLALGARLVRRAAA